MALLAFASIYLVTTSSAKPNNQRKLAQETAERFATEFTIAQAAGANLSNIQGVRTAIDALSSGIHGSGPYAGLVFQVPDIPPDLAKQAAEFLSFDRNILRYRPPIAYNVAWTSGSMPRQRTLVPNSLTRLLAERTAESFVRLFEASRAAAANLSAAIDVETSMKLLETGVNGQGGHTGTTFQIAPVQPNIRFLTKKMLHFENGNLYFVPDLERYDEAKMKALTETYLPAELAQQIVALYTMAKAGGADFSPYNTPNDIITALREGVRGSNSGIQFFRISAKATEEEWQKATAYLRLMNGILSYSRAKAR